MGPSRKKKTSIHTHTHTHTQSHNLQYKYNLKVDGGKFSFGLFDWCMREVVVAESVIPTQPNS